MLQWGGLLNQGGRIFFHHPLDFELAYNFFDRRFSIGRSKILARSICVTSRYGGNSLSAAEVSSTRASNLNNFIRNDFRGGYFFAPKIFRTAEL